MLSSLEGITEIIIDTTIFKIGIKIRKKISRRPQSSRSNFIQKKHIKPDNKQEKANIIMYA